MADLIRLLLVEDNPDDAELILLQLRRGGLEVVHDRVETASQFNAALDTQNWDIVLSDNQLPQFSGLAALGLLRNRGLDLPFILVSGTVGEETAVAAMRAGANDFIMKSALARLAPAVERELRDTKDRRAAADMRRQLKERDTQLAEAQRLGRVGAWHWNAATNTALWSEEMYRIFDRASDQPPLSFDEFLSRVHPEDRETITVRMMGREATQFGDDLRISLPDGTTRFVHMSGQIVRGANGLPVHVAGMALDVTDRKRAERQLREGREQLEARVLERTRELTQANASLQQQIADRIRAEASLRESETRFRQLADNIDEVFWIVSADNNVVYVSRAFETIWGLPRESL